MVSLKNRIERFFFAKVCLDFQDQFEDSIFIDESTVQMNKNANTIWFKVISGETRLGLIGKYKHAASVQPKNYTMMKEDSNIAKILSKLTNEELLDLSKFYEIETDFGEGSNSRT